MWNEEIRMRKMLVKVSASRKSRQEGLTRISQCVIMYLLKLVSFLKII